MKTFLLFWLCLLFTVPIFAVESLQPIQQVQKSESSQYMSKPEVRASIEKIVSALESDYLYPDKAQYVSQKLLAKLNTGGFADGYEREQFRRDVRAMLVKATQDTGLDIVLPEKLTIGRINSIEAESTQITASSVEVNELEGNIGSLRVSGDLNFYGAEQAIVEAFRSLSKVDALILDLRNADQVDMGLVHLMMSYFIEEGTSMGLVKFARNQTSLTALKINVPAKFKPNLPLYIINSSFVAGEWEYFGFTLQQSGKAVIMGEHSMGLNYFIKSVKISDEMVLKVPYALIEHPEANETWSKRGITPDYFASEDEDIVEKAYDLALKAITHN